MPPPWRNLVLLEELGHILVKFISKNDYAPSASLFSNKTMFGVVWGRLGGKAYVLKWPFGDHISTDRVVAHNQQPGVDRRRFLSIQ